jgi:hypothetical protein
MGVAGKPQGGEVKHLDMPIAKLRVHLQVLEREKELHSKIKATRPRLERAIRQFRYAIKILLKAEERK